MMIENLHEVVYGSAKKSAYEKDYKKLEEKSKTLVIL